MIFKKNETCIAWLRELRGYTVSFKKNETCIEWLRELRRYTVSFKKNEALAFGIKAAYAARYNDVTVSGQINL